MQDDLKPCFNPECGQNRQYNYTMDSGMIVTACDACGCNGPEAETEEQANEAWNSIPRPNPLHAAIVAQFSCVTVNENGTVYGWIGRKEKVLVFEGLKSWWVEQPSDMIARRVRIGHRSDFQDIFGDKPWDECKVVLP